MKYLLSPRFLIPAAWLYFFGGSLWSIAGLLACQAIIFIGGSALEIFKKVSEEVDRKPLLLNRGYVDVNSPEYLARFMPKA